MNPPEYSATGHTLLALFIVLSIVVSPWWLFGLLGLLIAVNI